METDSLVERLGRDLRPVRPRSPGREMAVLLLLAVAEIGGIFAANLVRPDMPEAMDTPSFWWKAVSMAVIAVVAGSVALLSMDPARSPKAGLRWVLALVPVIFATGWLIDAFRSGPAAVLARLDWPQGVGCVWKMVVLSVPPAIALAMFIHRGAPTDRFGTALAAGLSSAAWGAFIFVFACPSDDPLYIAVWYTLGCSLVAAISGVVFGLLARW